jgi:hypothetical protein
VADGPRCVVYGALAGRLTAERRGSEDLCGVLQMLHAFYFRVDPKGYSVTLEGGAAGAADAGAVPLSAGNAGGAACGLVATHRKPFVSHCVHFRVLSSLR